MAAPRRPRDDGSTIRRPDHTIASAVYATGAVGQLRAEEALEQVKFFRQG